VTTQVVFKRQTVTREAILAAMRRFDADYPDSNLYDRWLQKENYKYAVTHAGRVYPPKRILSLATSIPTSRFVGGDQTNNVFLALGFEVGSKWQMIGNS
jgi:hypothetical protein